LIDPPSLELARRAAAPLHLHMRCPVRVGHCRSVVIERAVAYQSPQRRLDLLRFERQATKAVAYLSGRQLPSRQHGERRDVRVA
jgi:hypothetical protein